MGDLDISLIKEFARRPGFYDRNDIHFKDKVYMAKGWTEIANQLGYEAHLLKERIYQLRNRYNLEKRRLENLRLESPNAVIESPWPLFQHLSFLDGHIRPRRSYKTMMRRNGSDDPTYFDQSNNNSNIEHPSSSSNVMVVANRKENPIAINNTRMMQTRNHSTTQISIDSTNSDNIQVKDENDSDHSEEEQNELNNEGHFMDPSNYLANGNVEVNEVSTVQQQNGTASRRDILASGIGVIGNQSKEVNNIAGTSRSTNLIKVRTVESLKNRDESHFIPPLKRHRRIARSEKYEAFGKFLAHSFCDLEEDKALTLVEKFTTEVVRALIANHNKTNGIFE